MSNIECRRNEFYRFYRKDWTSLLRLCGDEDREQFHPSAFRNLFLKGFKKNQRMTEEIEDKAYDLEDRLIDTLFYFLKDWAKRNRPSTFCGSLFFGSAVRFYLTSTASAWKAASLIKKETLFMHQRRVGHRADRFGGHGGPPYFSKMATKFM